MRVFSALIGFAGSLAGRLALILAVGIASASITSLFVAEQARQHDFERLQMERVVASTIDIASRFAHDPGRTGQLVHENRILGAREAPAGWRMAQPEADLTKLLALRLDHGSNPVATAMPQGQCFPNLDLRLRAAGMNEVRLPDCWFVSFRDAHGVERRLAIDLVPLLVPHGSIVDPVYLVLIVVASLILSLVVSRFATTPLRRLTRAARAFSVTIDPEPIPETGPREVRAALETFNVMQSRVREGFRERTQILAAVTHDLQTPLTRLRLRLEQVGDESLRERLISDLGVTQRLVRDGLELARSSESREPWSIVDIDSILSSVAEDASEFGAKASFAGGCGARMRVKPNALARCLNNLVDNAIKYGGNAELACRRSAGGILITVRDHGPGIPEEALRSVFEPFQRLARDGSGNQLGSGLGLAIARAQAETFGATLSLSNVVEGGLVAQIRIPTA